MTTAARRQPQQKSRDIAIGRWPIVQNFWAGVGAGVVSYLYFNNDWQSAASHGAMWAAVFMALRYSLDEPLDLLVAIGKGITFLCGFCANAAGAGYARIRERNDVAFYVSKVEEIAAECDALDRQLQESEKKRRQLQFQLDNKASPELAQPKPEGRSARMSDVEALPTAAVDFGEGDDYIHPYDHPVDFDKPISGVDKVAQNRIEIAQRILTHFEQFGNVSRDKCKSQSNIENRDWEEGRDFLEEIGAIEKVGRSWKMAIDVADVDALISKYAEQRNVFAEQFPGAIPA